jgi:PHD/YefM family antitoxin component YafN of YafNO toxin-antitoxin module
MTYQVSADYAEHNFNDIIQKAQKEAEGVVITQGDRTFILIEKSKLKTLQEAAQFEQLPNLFKNASA